MADATTDRSTQSRLRGIVDNLKQSDSLLDSADKNLKVALARQIEQLQQGAPQAKAVTEGWIYLGHVDDRGNWTYTNVTRVEGGIPSLVSGQNVRTQDQLYVRADAPPGQHASARVLGLLPSGSTARISQIESAPDSLGLGLSDHPKPANGYHLKTGQREWRPGH